jgi:hypothetical protein
LPDTQDESGAWLPTESPMVSCDQTGKVAIWLREIAGKPG